MRKLLLPVFIAACIPLYAQSVIGFEGGVPEGFTSSQSELSVTSNLYKEGKQSLEWNFGPESTLEIALKKPIVLNKKSETKGGTTLWLYNEQPAQDSVRFEFLDEAGKVRYWFTYRLASQGWRACWIGFKSMRGDKLQAGDEVTLTHCRLVAPKRKGRVYLDRWKMFENNMNLRTTPDMQIAYNDLAVGRDLWHWCRVWEWEQYTWDIPRPEVLSAAQKKDLKTVEANLDKVIVAPTNVSGLLKKAEDVYAKAAITPFGNGFAGAPVVAPDEQNKKAGELSWNDLETMLSGFAFDAVRNQSKESEERYFTVWKYAMDQGFAFGSGMGTNHHYGYQVRKIYTTAWLMRDRIARSPLQADIISTLSFWSALQETRRPCPEVRDEMLDSWNTLLQAKLIAAMMLVDERDRVQALQGLSRWVSGSVKYTPGTIGGIKVDGTTFHHGGFYPGYTTGALATVADYVAMTSGTEFVPTLEARQRLANAFLTMRNYCNMYEWGTGIGGRHPFTGKMGAADIKAFAQLALSGDLSGEGGDFDRHLAADYLRLIGDKDTPEARFFKEKGVKAAEAPEGFFVYNYGAAGIFRRGEWMVTLKGYNTNVWGSEIYTKDNRYGRYQSYGSAQIMGQPSRSASGFVENGWDWNRLPGTTTIHLPFDLLENPRPGTLMARSDEEFAGASSLEDKNGMFAMKLSEADYPNFTPDFVARKSVFCFDNHMVCLGTGISNSNAEYPTETTLFQSEYRSGKNAISVNGKKADAVGFETQLEGDGKCLIGDGYGNYYQVNEGTVKVQIAEQESRNERTKAANKGTFASAYLLHGKAPKDATYSYTVWIQPTGKQLAAARKQEVCSVLRRDNVAHIVKDHATGITAYAAFEQTEVGGTDCIAKIPAETMVMKKESGKQLVISVCDPNLHIEEKTYTTPEPSAPSQKKLVLNGKWSLATDTDRVKVTQNGDQTEVTVTCQHGLPVEFTLNK